MKSTLTFILLGGLLTDLHRRNELLEAKKPLPLGISNCPHLVSFNQKSKLTHKEKAEQTYVLVDRQAVVAKAGGMNNLFTKTTRLITDSKELFCELCKKVRLCLLRSATSHENERQHIIELSSISNVA